MKSHYYKEVVVLILLSLAAAALAADHNFYDLLWEVLGWDHDGEEKKKIFEHTVAFIRFIAIGFVIILSIVNLWAYLHSEKKIVGSLLASIFKIYFDKIDVSKSDANKKNIYRTTCFKYYGFSTLRSIVYGILFAAFCFFAIPTVVSRIQFNGVLTGIIAFIIILGIVTILLWVVDDWWFQFFKRLLRFKKGRNMIIGKNYLLSYARYGYESGSLKTGNTT